MNNIQVVGLGALNTDHIYEVECILEDGETAVKGYATSPGGSAANTICGLAKLGTSTGFIGAVGDDAEGKILRQDLQEAGVDTTLVKVKPGARTGKTLCLNDEFGRRSVYVLHGANNLLALENSDLEYINKGKWLHVSSFVGDAQFKMLLELIDGLEPSVRLSFSPGALYSKKGLEALRPVLARTHILFINHNEIRQLTGDEVSTGAEICQEHGCRIIAVTLGKGANYKSTDVSSYIMSMENEYLVTSVQQDTPVVDTNGAGDAFAAGFLFGLINEKGLEECGRLGDITARFSIARAGARQGLPALAELSRCYRQLYNQTL